MKVVVQVNEDMAEFLRMQECDPGSWDDEMKSLANDIACHVIEVVKTSPPGS